ncbi:MAG TPA: hypothetical protein VGO50_07665, partial [Pyrinomonadaceae bacterium]|nr:hypothetical protein [Pyrinomonadaceae bacterium]
WHTSFGERECELAYAIDKDGKLNPLTSTGPELRRAAELEARKYGEGQLDKMTTSNSDKDKQRAQQIIGNQARLAGQEIQLSFK